MRGHAFLLCVLLAISVVAVVTTWPALWRLANPAPKYVTLVSGQWVALDMATLDFDTAPPKPSGWSVQGGSVSFEGEPVTLPRSEDLTAIEVAGDNRVVAVGASGQVVERGIDGVWRVILAGGPPLRAIVRTPTGQLYIVGDKGFLARVSAPLFRPYVKPAKPTGRPLDLEVRFDPYRKRHEARPKHGHVTVLASKGPDLTDIRYDPESQRFEARVVQRPSSLTDWLGIGLLVLIAIYLLVIASATAKRLIRWLRARRLNRVWTHPKMAIDFDQHQLSFEMSVQSLRNHGKGHAMVKLLAYTVTIESRSVRYSVADTYDLNATSNGDVTTCTGTLEVDPRLVEELRQAKVEWVMEFEPRFGQARAIYRGRLPV